MTPKQAQIHRAAFGDDNLTLTELRLNLKVLERQFDLARSIEARRMLSRNMADLRRKIARRIETPPPAPVQAQDQADAYGWSDPINRAIVCICLVLTALIGFGVIG
ncbi:MAG: hypothetical protein ACRCV9_14450 [Burkholderiaceae bacterium]